MPFSLLKFRPKTPAAPEPPAETIKYGIYTLGGEDVIMSVPTLDVILYQLRQGTPAEQQELAAVLQRMVDAFQTTGE